MSWRNLYAHPFLATAGPVCLYTCIYLCLFTRKPAALTKQTIPCCRSAPNSPASKYRRQSYALSRDQPTAVSMKNMMSELGSRLSNRRQNKRRSSSFNGSLDIPELLRGTLNPVPPPFSDPDAKHEGGTPPRADDLISEESASSEDSSEDCGPDVKTELAVDPANPVLTPKLTPPGVAAPPIDKESKNNAAPPSLKEMFAELTAKAQAQKERSSDPTTQMGCQENVLPPRSPPPPPPRPPPPPPPPLPTQQQQKQKKAAGDAVNKSPGNKAKPVSMKELMAELEMKAKARAEKYAA